jgi:hypothetical protein
VAAALKTPIGYASVSGTLASGASPDATAAFTPQTVGAYWWYARYEGDPNNNSVASSCGAGMPETIVGAPLPVLSGLVLDLSHERHPALL